MDGGVDEAALELGDVGFGDVQTYDVDLDREEGDGSDAQAEELVLVAVGGGEFVACLLVVDFRGGGESDRRWEERDCAGSCGYLVHVVLAVERDYRGSACAGESRRSIQLHRFV